MHVFGAYMATWKKGVKKCTLKCKNKIFGFSGSRMFHFFFRNLVTLSKFISKFVQECNTKIYKDERKKYEIMLWYYHVASCYFCSY